MSKRPALRPSESDRQERLSGDWLSIKSASAYLNVSPRSLYRAVRRGDLRAAAVNGRDLRISRAWLTDWLDAQVRVRHAEDR